MTTLPVPHGYAWVSKADDDAMNRETQVQIPGLRRRGQRLLPAAPELAVPDGDPKGGDTVVMAFWDQFSRNFEEGREDPGGPDALNTFSLCSLQLWDDQGLILGP